MIKNILAVIGALYMLVTAAVILLAILSRLAGRRRLRRTRDQRAIRPAEQVAKSPAMWSDFFLDHGLHKVIRTPKEWKA
ncbi:hypothetical protein ACGF0J_14105 [Nonomuraea sp. NPDC047897]|uniref:hypothetical protein n=1 Tax=Nonomuraea sp. NPDC047897 TaxID=3364346 RepID=UPI00371CD8B8